MLLRSLLALALLVWMTMPVEAHRPGESYIYVDVTETEMTGRFHIRLADLTKAVDLDANRDGFADEAEFEAKASEVHDYLIGRLTFYDGTKAHKVQISGHSFFGPDHSRQVDISFDVPSLGPPPEALSVEYRFLYDGPDPAHRPMLLQASNTRLRLAHNESIVSLVFEEDAERQTVSLVPPPMSEIFMGFIMHGAHQILSEPARVLFAVALLLPVVMLRSGTGWTPRETTNSAVAAAALVTTLFALGFVATLSLAAFQVFALSSDLGQGMLALSVILLAFDNFRPLPYLRGAHVALVLGALHGLGPNDFIKELGLHQAFAEIALAGFGVGLWIAMALVAGVVIPLLALVRRDPLYPRLALRYSSVPLALGTALWFV